MRQITDHVCRRPRLAIKADGGGILLLLSASYVENKHDVSPVGFSINNVQRHVIEPVLKAGELAEVCGFDVVVDVAEVPMVGDIEDP